MKAILISVHKNWIVEMAHGRKKSEVRKGRPKLQPPFKCYIYATKKGRPLVMGSPTPCYVDDNLVQTLFYSFAEADRIWGCWDGKVVGEFVCDRIDEIYCERLDNGVCYDPHYYTDEGEKEFMRDCCLTEFDLERYLGYKGVACLVGYGWHISDLEIYDEPKELSQFKRMGACKDAYLGKDCGISCKYLEHICCEAGTQSCCGYESITRPPQSWCYVEELYE